MKTEPIIYVAVTLLGLFLGSCATSLNQRDMSPLGGLSSDWKQVGVHPPMFAPVEVAHWDRETMNFLNGEIIAGPEYCVRWFIPRHELSAAERNELRQEATQTALALRTDWEAVRWDTKSAVVDVGAVICAVPLAFLYIITWGFAGMGPPLL